MTTTSFKKAIMALRNQLDEKKITEPLVSNFEKMLQILQGINLTLETLQLKDNLQILDQLLGGIKNYLVNNPDTILSNTFQTLIFESMQVIPKTNTDLAAKWQGFMTEVIKVEKGISQSSTDSLEQTDDLHKILETRAAEVNEKKEEMQVIEKKIQEIKELIIQLSGEGYAPETLEKSKTARELNTEYESANKYIKKGIKFTEDLNKLEIILRIYEIEVFGRKTLFLPEQYRQHTFLKTSFATKEEAKNTEDFIFESEMAKDIITHLEALKQITIQQRLEREEKQKAKFAQTHVFPDKPEMSATLLNARMQEIRKSLKGKTLEAYSVATKRAAINHLRYLSLLNPAEYERQQKKFEERREIFEANKTTITSAVIVNSQATREVINNLVITLKEHLQPLHVELQEKSKYDKVEVARKKLLPDDGCPKKYEHRSVELIKIINKWVETFVIFLKSEPTDITERDIKKFAEQIKFAVEALRCFENFREKVEPRDYQQGLSSLKLKYIIQKFELIEKEFDSITAKADVLASWKAERREVLLPSFAEAKPETGSITLSSAFLHMLTDATDRNMNIVASLQAYQTAVALYAETERLRSTIKWNEIYATLDDIEKQVINDPKWCSSAEPWQDLDKLEVLLKTLKKAAEKKFSLKIFVAIINMFLDELKKTYEEIEKINMLKPEHTRRKTFSTLRGFFDHTRKSTSSNSAETRHSLISFLTQEFSSLEKINTQVKENFRDASSDRKNDLLTLKNLLSDLEQLIKIIKTYAKPTDDGSSNDTLFRSFNFYTKASSQSLGDSEYNEKTDYIFVSTEGIEIVSLLDLLRNLEANGADVLKTLGDLASQKQIILQTIKQLHEKLFPDLPKIIIDQSTVTSVHQTEMEDLSNLLIGLALLEKKLGFDSKHVIPAKYEGNTFDTIKFVNQAHLLDSQAKCLVFSTKKGLEALDYFSKIKYMLPELKPTDNLRQHAGIMEAYNALVKIEVELQNAERKPKATRPRARTLFMGPPL